MLVIQYLAEIALDVFHNQVNCGELGLIFHCFFVGEGVKQLGGEMVIVYLAQFVHNLNFSCQQNEVFLMHLLYLCLDINHLNSHLSVRGQVYCLEYLAIGSLAYCLEYSIVLEVCHQILFFNCLHYSFKIK